MSMESTTTRVLKRNETRKRCLFEFVLVSKVRMGLSIEF